MRIQPGWPSVRMERDCTSAVKAKDRFAENALYYQEDFMFMGTNAFLFYYPVLEDYLRNAPDEENDDHYESWVISQCIRTQFDADTNGRLRALIPAIKDLSKFIRENIRRFGCNDAERTQVSAAWADLVQHIESLDQR